MTASKGLLALAEIEHASTAMDALAEIEACFQRATRQPRPGLRLEALDVRAPAPARSIVSLY